ncbi:hypothetical protein VPH35_051117 [Triticum aestivum]
MDGCRERPDFDSRYLSGRTSASAIAGQIRRSAVDWILLTLDFLITRRQPKLTSDDYYPVRMDGCFEALPVHVPAQPTVQMNGCMLRDVAACCRRRRHCRYSLASRHRAGRRGVVAERLRGRATVSSFRVVNCSGQILRADNVFRVETERQNTKM